MENPTEDLKELETRLRAILETLGKVLESPENLSYDQPLFWYENPYDLSKVLGEIDSSVQSLENNLQMLAERESPPSGL